MLAWHVLSASPILVVPLVATWLRTAEVKELVGATAWPRVVVSFRTCHVVSLKAITAMTLSSFPIDVTELRTRAVSFFHVSSALKMLPLASIRKHTSAGKMHEGGSRGGGCRGGGQCRLKQHAEAACLHVVMRLTTAGNILTNVACRVHSGWHNRSRCASAIRTSHAHGA